MSNQETIYVNFFHEKKSGEIVLTTGSYSNRVSWRNNDGDIGSVSIQEYQTWKLRKDLQDFPNAKDPKLPYVFDLNWDIKYLSDLKVALSNDWIDDKDQLIQTINEYPEVKKMLEQSKEND